MCTTVDVKQDVDGKMGAVVLENPSLVHETERDSKAGTRPAETIVLSRHLSVKLNGSNHQGESV